MKKHLLALSLMVALGASSAAAQVTIEGSSEEYTSVGAAVAASQTGAVINVNESMAIETVSGKNYAIGMEEGDTRALAVKGAEGVVLSYKGIFVVSTQSASCSLTMENLTLKYALTTATGRSSIAVGRGSLYLKDVTVEDANTTSATGIIALNNGNSNIPNVVLDNVKLVNCTTTAPAQVVVNNSNVELKGNTELSIQLKGTNFIRSAEGFTGHVTLVLDATRAANSVVVKNCTDPTLFTIEGVEGMMLQAQDGNLVLAEVPAVLNETTGIGYTTLPAAVNAAERGSVLVLYKDATVASRIDLGAKVLTVKGATGAEKIDCSDSNLNNRYLFNLNTAGAELMLENLVIDGGNTERTAALFQPSNGAILNVKNVKFVDCSTTFARGLIDNPGSNAGTWHLDGVTFENCTVLNQHVTSNAAGNSIAGDNSLTLRINVTDGNYNTVDAAGVSNSTPVLVTLANVGDAFQDKPVFTNCTDTEQFTCANDNYYFSNYRSNGNLIVRKLGSTGIADVEAEDSADAEWFNLQGMRVQPTVPGVYIKRQGGKSVKVYKK